MSATEELRRMLTEAGVEWWPEKYYKDACTVWRANGMEWRASEQTDGRLLVGCTSLAHLTPEQAIAATLGPAARHPKPHEQWTTVLLSEIAWGWDDRWPDYLSVAHDAHGEWRVYVPEDTLGSCNCSNNCTNSGRTCGEWRNASSYYDPTGVDAELWCEHCDEPLEVDWGFCPYCGRRVAPDCGRKVVSA